MACKVLEINKVLYKPSTAPQSEATTWGHYSTEKSDITTLGGHVIITRKANELHLDWIKSYDINLIIEELINHT